MNTHYKAWSNGSDDKKGGLSQGIEAMIKRKGDNNAATTGEDQECKATMMIISALKVADDDGLAGRLYCKLSQASSQACSLVSSTVGVLSSFVLYALESYKSRTKRHTEIRVDKT